MQNKTKGFTLIEVLIVLTILSVLALIAYPNYKSYFYKSNRLDAMNSLFHYQALWQQCMFNLPDANACLQQINLDPRQTQPSLAHHYKMSAQQSEIIQFQAKPIDNQAHDTECALWLLDEHGVKLAYNDAQQDTTKQCW